jgi:hypothetical protein
MKKSSLRQLIFMALCCDLGLFSKRLVAPIANVITEALHIPGGIATSFSLMFLVVAVALMDGFGLGVKISAVQSVIALSFGMVGSLGVLAPIGYIIPGLVIDICFFFARRLNLPQNTTIFAANMLAAASASLTANLLVFRLYGLVLMLYVSVALSSGTICGMLGCSVVSKIAPVIVSEKYTTRMREL